MKTIKTLCPCWPRGRLQRLSTCHHLSANSVACWTIKRPSQWCKRIKFLMTTRQKHTTKQHHSFNLRRLCQAPFSIAAAVTWCLAARIPPPLPPSSGSLAASCRGRLRHRRSFCSNYTIMILVGGPMKNTSSVMQGGVSLSLEDIHNNCCLHHLEHNCNMITTRIRRMQLWWTWMHRLSNLWLIGFNVWRPR